MENEHELSYETLTRVYLGSYEHYKRVGAEVEHPKPGFELQGAKMEIDTDVGGLWCELGGLESRLKVLDTLEAATAVMARRREMWLQFGPKKGWSSCISYLGNMWVSHGGTYVKRRV
ncbi:hypothetical protein Tco_0636913 [Tanacetum coccineum]